MNWGRRLLESPIALISGRRLSNVPAEPNHRAILIKKPPRANLREEHEVARLREENVQGRLPWADNEGVSGPFLKNRGCSLEIQAMQPGRNIPSGGELGRITEP